MQSAKQQGDVGLPHPRLVELVMHLSDCSPGEAIRSVDAAVHVTPGASTDDPLMIIATALVGLRRVDIRERIDVREQPHHRIGSEPVA